MGDKNSSSHKRHCMVVFAHYPAGETRVQRQTEALINHGFEVDIICLRVIYSGYEPPTEVVNGAQVYRLPVTRSYGNTNFVKQLLEYLAFFFRAMWMLIRLYPRRHYQVVQVHNLPDFLVFAAWFPKLLGARLILDLHDLMPEFYAARTGRGMSNWLVRIITWQEQLSCRFANHVVTVTELWRQTLIQRGVPSDKVSVVMNVADDRIFRRPAKNGSPKDKNTLQLFYHGAIVPRYGLDLVLEAVARLRDEIPGLRLTIHGDGDYRATLAELAAQLGLGDQVYFSTKLRPVSELPGLICSADGGIVPYRRDIFTDGI
jgi:glycosyltransferase involved in cell wall biosynthesis